MSNPLLNFDGLPLYADFKPEHISPALDAQLAEARTALATATAAQTPVTWDTVVEDLTDATDRLARLGSRLEQITGLVETAAWREEFNKNVTRIPEFFTEFGQNRDLLSRYKALAASDDFATWSPARRAVIDKAILEFRLSGVDLDQDSRTRFTANEKRLNELAHRFGQNVTDATDVYQLHITDKARLSGIPEHAQTLYQEAARAAGKDGWIIRLQGPSFSPAYQYADDRTLRAELYEANAKRASEFGPAEKDNTPIIREWLTLLADQARLLGYPHYADLSLVRKMADTPSQAIAFLRDLAKRCKPQALQERRELEEYAASALGLENLQPWDLAFTAEKLQEARYSYTSEEVKQYFPAPQVLNGLFALLQRLYGITFETAETSLWHPDARYYRVLLRGEEIAGIYLDLYARDAKRSGGWMDGVFDRRVRSGSLQRPVAQVVCNFTPPTGGKPSILEHNEVSTLFHEFGHALQHLLTRVDEIAVSGINGVEWDAVELPSQFMENYCWEWEVIQSLSSHVDTGSPLPRELFDKMLAAKSFCVGIGLVKQVELGLFDLLIYSDFDPIQGDWLALLNEIRREVAVNFPPPWHRFPNAFSHIFAGSYAAGYYSYLWAEVLSADAYEAFQETNHAPETGRRFLDEILAVGGSRPSAESFRAFRGRDPKIDALLAQKGID